MAKQNIIQTFDGGLAEDVYEWLVPHNMVAFSQNFLFERGQMQSRPPVRSGQSALGAGSIIDSFMPMFPPIAGNSAQMYGTYKTSQTDGTCRLFRVQPLYATSSTSLAMPPTEATLTTPATSGGFYPNCAQYDGKTYVYGAYDAAGVPKLLQIDNVTHVVTAITLPGANATSIARFRPFPICTHLSRVFIIDPGLPTLSFPTVYWSKIGDPTVWTGDFTTGNARLQEASDGIRGMGVMQNMIIIARPTGFHAGIPTGNGANPYDWKTIMKDGPGCIYPESFCIFGDMCFFAGQNDIYMYDLQNVQSIGAGISNDLFASVQWNGMGVRMFVTTGYDNRRTPQLHAIPTWVPSAYIADGTTNGTVPTVDMTTTPHFVYDLVEKKWSRHIYDQAASDPYPLEGVALTWDVQQIGTPNTGARNTYQRPCLIRRPTNGPAQYMMWDPFAPNNGCESVQIFKTGTFTVGEDSSIEGKLVRFMPVIRSSVDNVVVQVQIDWMQGNTPKTDTASFTIVSSGYFNRYWINKVLVGNLFQFTFTIPANSDVQVRQIVFQFDADTQEVFV